jgi:hypothetical protein
VWVDLIIGFTLLEGLALALYFRSTGRGVAPAQFGVNLASGLCCAAVDCRVAARCRARAWRRSVVALAALRQPKKISPPAWAGGLGKSFRKRTSLGGVRILGAPYVAGWCGPSLAQTSIRFPCDSD